MYDIIQGFIDHVWQTGSYADGSQSYVYVFALIILVVMLVTVIDLVRSVFDRFIK